MKTLSPVRALHGFILLAILMLSSPVHSAAQGNNAATLSAAPISRAITYTIALTDRLRIGVFQEPDLSIISRVDSKGNINLNLVGPVRVYGLTIEEAEKKVESAYRDGRFLRGPQVTINVEEYAPREISIQGEVLNPGRYPLPVESGMTVLTAITKAQGFTDQAKGSEVRITRVLPDGSTKTFTVDVSSLIRGRSGARAEDASMLLLPDDVVYVPTAIF